MPMKRVILASGLAVSPGLSALAAQPPADFHVAVSGKDSNPGTAQKPFATLQRAREAVPGLAVTTDVMVGFPGETEQEFEATLRAFEELQFDQAFMFKYNDRPGTRAAGMEPKVPEAEKQRRLERLVTMQNEIAREKNRRLLGQSFRVLVEEPDPRTLGHVRGRTRTNKLMIFPGEPELIGQVTSVTAEKGYLWGFVGSAVGSGASGSPLAARHRSVRPGGRRRDD